MREPISDPVSVNGRQTLLFKSELLCGLGSQIRFMTGGQVPLSPAEVDRIVAENTVAPGRRTAAGAGGIKQADDVAAGTGKTGKWFNKGKCGKEGEPVDVAYDTLGRRSPRQFKDRKPP